MISRLAEARDRLSEAFSRERRIIEKATCCLKLDTNRLIKLVDDAETLYKAVLDALIDEANEWMSKLNERVGRKGTRYLATEWRGIRIVIQGGTIVVWATKRFAEEIGAPYPSARVDIEPIEPIAVDVRRKWAIGWHASDADVDDKDRPRMRAHDIGQILSWSLAWPGRFRVAMRGLVIGKKTKPIWHAYSLSHKATELIPEAIGPANGDKAKSPKYRLIKMLNDPLALLAYTLGDGSPTIGAVHMLRWAIAPSHMDELVDVVSGVVDCRVMRRERHMEIYVTGECASALAKTMLNALESDMPIGKRLLDVVYGDEPNSKYGRLIALANWKPRIDKPLLRLDAPRIEICGYAFGVYFNESNGLFADTDAGEGAGTIVETIKRCLNADAGIRIVRKGKRIRIELSTTVLEVALKKLARENPIKAKQTIEAIVDYLIKRAEEYEARGKTRAAQWAKNKAKQLITFLTNK